MKKKEGFTLVELLAVIVILALLITISVPAVQRAINASRKVGINDFANKVFKKTEELFIGSFITELENYVYFDETGLIIDIKALGLDTYGEYEGFIYYNYLTDEYTIYIHDNINMIVNYTYTDNDKELNDIVKKYNSSEASKFELENICHDHTDDYMCIYTEGGPAKGIYFNTFPGAAIIPVDDLSGSGFNLHNVIRQMVKPGTVEYSWGSDRENETQPIDNIYHVEVVQSATQPAGSYKISPVDENGIDLCEYPVYISFDYSTGTLYFTSSQETISLYQSCRGLFRYFTNLKDIDLTKFNFDYVSNTSAMFDHCINLEVIKKDYWPMRLNGDMSSMFRYCKKLTQVDVSSWSDISLVYFDYMFEHCESLKTVDVSRWDVSRAKWLTGIFTHCYELEIVDVSNWDTGNVESISWLFNRCYKLNNINLSKWKTSRITHIISTFNRCNALTELDISNWDTRNVVNMNNTFERCYALKSLDLSKWNLSNLKEMTQAFHGSYKLENIILGNTKNNNSITLTDNFWDCRSLKVLDLSQFNKIKFSSSDFALNKKPNVIYVSSSYTGPLTVTAVGVGNVTLTKI